jgi:hypothetical protein
VGISENIARMREIIKDSMGPEHRRLDRYARLLAEARAMLEGPVLPRATEAARKAYEAWRLERIAWLLPGGNRRMGGERRLRLRAYRLPMLLVHLGECPRGPRPPAGRKGYHEVLDRIEEEPGIIVEITDDYDDVCLSCLDMTVDGCVKQIEERREDLRINIEVAEVIGIKIGEAMPAKKALDITAEKLEDASKWVGIANGPRYRRGRAVWLARRQTAMEKGAGTSSGPAG